MISSIGAASGRGPFRVRILLQCTIQEIAACKPCRQVWINGRPAVAKSASCSRMCSVSLSGQLCCLVPYSLAESSLNIHVSLTLVYADGLLCLSQIVQQRHMAALVTVEAVRRPASAVQECRQVKASRMHLVSV